MRSVWIMTSVGLLWAIQVHAVDSKDELRRLDGEWVAVSWGESGRYYEPAPETKSVLSMSIKGKTIRIDCEGTATTGTLAIDPNKTPKTIDRVWPKTSDRPHVIELGIYTFDGTTLKVCYAEHNAKRPTKFWPGDGQRMVVFRRKDQIANPQQKEDKGKSRQEKPEKRMAITEIEGQWRLLRHEEGGKPLPKGECDAFMQIRENKMTHTAAGVDFEEETFTTNEKKDPKEIDLVIIDEQTKKTKRILGIYLLRGNSLTVCYSKRDGKRPTQFSTKENDGLHLQVFERQP